ncbi:acetamidase/formamidase family protein [Bacillus sp. 31A1R]|uniref:Acetamidase/formamidase family protein n=1 Tax=Robertmurraya mangrovi TaxID=3098077 RepID=A0ABU5J3A4_9BACI|nr:acetamidase/formamidase family protein [Bacillus sp. 31A1R]MDZ5473837.1 acetamidase/formamidase family protein [Bacillus sp. 31A1R]
MTIHTIKTEDQHVHGSFSKEYEPILSVNSGDTIRFNSLDIGWGYSSSKGVERKRYQSREQESTWGHPIIGPIRVNGAKPGMTLEIKINDLVPGWYGWNCAGGKMNWHNEQLGLTDVEELTLNWELDRVKQVAKTEINNQPFSVPLQPFLGLMSNAPSEEGVHSTIPPRYFGGNIDCKELVRGSSLFLPIAVDGALFSAGDGHALQGDGEVSGQAIECPMDLVDLTLIVHDNLTLSSPRANTPVGWITFGFHEDLNVAMVMALEEMITFIQEHYNVSKPEATALASVVVDLRITQIVNQVKGVHAVLPHGAIR